MNDITITGRHFDIDADLESYIESELKYMDEKFKRLMEAQVILIREKHRKIAEVTIHADGNNYYAKEESDDLYVSFDNALEKVQTQIKRFRSKRREESRNHSKKEELLATGEPAQRDRYLEEELGEPVIVPVDLEMAKPMAEEEAAMQLQASNNIFLPFINARTERMNVIYKRSDGTFGLIEPPKH